jgi:ferredoxin
MSMMVKIDRYACVSCGSCWNLCPDFFEEDPLDSFSRITEPYRANGSTAEGTPTENLESCARDAADLCPVRIITIENE